MWRRRRRTPRERLRERGRGRRGRRPARRSRRPVGVAQVAAARRRSAGPRGQLTAGWTSSAAFGVGRRVRVELGPDQVALAACRASITTTGWSSVVGAGQVGLGHRAACARRRRACRGPGPAPTIVWPGREAVRGVVVAAARSARPRRCAASGRPAGPAPAGGATASARAGSRWARACRQRPSPSGSQRAPSCAAARGARQQATSTTASGQRRDAPAACRPCRPVRRRRRRPPTSSSRSPTSA